MESENKGQLAEIVNKLKPAGVKDILMPRLRKLSDMRRMSDSERWSEYTRFPDLTLNELVKQGLVIIPDLKLSHAYKAFRQEKGGFFPNAGYSHLEREYRDGWNRFMETVLSSRPNQIIWITEDNNLLPNYKGMKLSKDGHVVTSVRHGGLDEVTTLAAYDAASRLVNLEVGDLRVGIDRQGVDYDKKSVQVYHLSDVFRAQIMDQLIPLRIGNDFIGDVSFYPGAADVWNSGMEAIVRNVPSLSRPGEVHHVSLHGIPIVDSSRLDRGGVSASHRSLIMSYNFSADDTCEKPVLWTIKYGRQNVYVFDAPRRKTREHWEDTHAVFGYLRMMRVAEWERKGQIDPGRNFVVLPMYPEPTTREAKQGFRKLYGMLTSNSTEGGVIVEDRRSVGTGQMQATKIYRHPLSSRLVDLDIVLHNLIAFVKDPMTPRKPKVNYDRITAA